MTANDWKSFGFQVLGDAADAGASILKAKADENGTKNNAPVIPSEAKAQPWLMWGMIGLGVVVAFLLIRRK